MFMVKLCIYFCMYLLQVVSRPPQLGIELDLFQCVQLAKEVQLGFCLSLGSVNAQFCPSLTLVIASVLMIRTHIRIEGLGRHL